MHRILTQDYFALFGLEPRFGLPADALDKAYRELVARVHPDRFAHGTDTERRLSLQWATHANEAYRTLKKPVLRARYLLTLHAVETRDDSSPVPPKLLAEQMEWREALADAVHGRDNAGLARLEAAVQQRHTILHDRLARQLDTEHDYPGAAETVRQFMFLDKLATDIGDASATDD